MLYRQNLHLQLMQAAPKTPVRTNHPRCIGYAIRTIFRVSPALGRETDHANPPPGLSFRHFAMGGVICALSLVGAIVLVVRVVLAVALP